MAARLLALVAAVAMVLGSLALRNRMDGGGGITRGPRDGLRVTCATELERVCAALRPPVRRFVATVEPAPITAQRLMTASAADAGVDLWLAPGPWAAMVDEDRQRRNLPPLLEPPGRPLARSPLIAVLRKDRANELRAGPCGPAIGWKCIGTAATRTPPIRLGAPPATEAEGALVRAAAVAGFVGTSDFSISDVTDDADTTAWLDGLERSIKAARDGGATDLQRFLVARGSAEGFLVTQAAAVIALAPAATATKEQFEQVFIAPPATADVFVGQRRGGRGLGEDERLVLDILHNNGWIVPGREPIVGMDPAAPPLPDDDGLPSPGVLQALLRDLF